MVDWARHEVGDRRFGYLHAGLQALLSIILGLSRIWLLVALGRASAAF